MGGAPKEEDPLDAAKRELKEETGLSARQWTTLMHVYVSNSITDEEGFVYVARRLSEGEPDFEDTENITIRKLPLSQAIAMATSGEINDAISVAALLKISRQQSS